MNSNAEGDKLIVISADTVVESVGGTILEKPRNKDARAMMKRQSNSSHKVHTGVCIAYNTNTNNIEAAELKHFSETTIVNFAEIEPKEVEGILVYDDGRTKPVRIWGTPLRL